MSLPETCPFCGCFGEVRNGDTWVGYTCMTTIRAGQDVRRMQSRTCEGLERTRLLASLATLEAEAKQARDDEAWAHRQVVSIYRRGESWVAEHFDGRQIMYAEVPTIAAALRALREKVEGGAR